MDQYVIIETPQEKYRAWALDTAQKMSGMKFRETSLTLATTLNPYGCTGLMDPCGDNDFISLAMAGADPLLDALGWRPSNVCRIIKQYLTWVGTANQAGQNPGAVTPNNIVAACCDDRNAVSYGACEFEMSGFGHLGNSGGAVCLYDDIKECENMPDRFFLDGSPVSSNLQFRALIAAEVILQTLRWMVKNGNASTAGHFDGLDRIITTGVLDRQGNACPALDSVVIDWGSGCFAGDATSTWTDGRSATPIAIPEGTSLIDIFFTLNRYMARRRSMSPALNSQGFQLGDVFIAGSSDRIECLRMCNVCHTMCPGSTSENIQIVINQRESREYYTMLNTGPANRFGFGYMNVKGVNIPYIEADYLGDDLYFLWRKAGNVPLLWGEYQDTNSLDTSRIPGNTFRPSDGGRFLHYTQTDNTCVQEVVDMRPRLRYDGRWMQARILDFTCDMPVTVPHADPFNVGFYIPGPLVAKTA